MGSTLFGFNKYNQPVHSFILSTGDGFQAEILSYGAILRRLIVPIKETKSLDVVLGCETLKDYEDSQSYLGCIVGRVANRIKNGRFELNGQLCQLNINNPPNHLHGGFEGFNKKIWPLLRSDKDQVALTYTSESGEENYPGEVRATVTYTLKSNRNAKSHSLIIRLQANCTSTTPINLANHSYFNLAGHAGLENHYVTLCAERYMPVDKNHLATGQIKPVFGTLFDFTSSQNLMSRITESLKLHQEYAYDNYFCLNDDRNGAQTAAEVYSPSSGIRLSVKTTYPGFQFYTGDYLENHARKRDHSTFGHGYSKRSGFCIEAHKYPDAVNNPAFPTIFLDPVQTYDEYVEYTFHLESC